LAFCCNKVKDRDCNVISRVNPLSAKVGCTPHDIASLIAPRKGKIIKNDSCVFERGENLLQNCILRFVFKLSQSSEIVLQN